MSLRVDKGRIVAILGANGAEDHHPQGGYHLLRAERGEVTKGSIELEGQRIDRLTPNELVRLGVCQVMEGRHCFQHLTVEEHPDRAYTRGLGRADLKRELEPVYEYFPRLRERRSSQAGYTSGGEQQMTAVGRAMMAQPKMLLLDEPSMGLAPQLVAEIFEIARRSTGTRGSPSFSPSRTRTSRCASADYGYIVETLRCRTARPRGWPRTTT